MARQGIVVEPYQKLKLEQVEQIHRSADKIEKLICGGRW